MQETEHVTRIPEAAVLRRESNGVQWYTAVKGGEATHYMHYNGYVLPGKWCGPRHVFWALASMSVDERRRYDTYDERMGQIAAWLKSSSERRS